MHALLDIELLQENSLWKQKVHFFESIDSTNNFALELGESGSAEGTFVIAETQTHGRGQFHRPWSSLAGMGLWLSLLLRLPIEQEIIAPLSHFAVVALCDAIEQSKIKVDHLHIKEPNDLLIEGKKVAGVLVETRRGASPFAVVGIGVNIYQQEKDFPEEIRKKVTSLVMASSTSDIDRQEFAMHLIQSLYQYYQQLHHDPQRLHEAWCLRQ